MGQEQSSTLGGGLPGAANSMPFANVPGQPTQQHFSMTALGSGSGSHQRQLRQPPVVGRSRRRPLAPLYSSETVPSAPSVGNRAENDENHPQDHLVTPRTEQFTFDLPNLNVIPPRSGFGPPAIPLPSPVAQPVLPRESSNKMFKLEMNIDSSDGKISGKLVVEDAQTAAASRANLCGACKSPLANHGEGESQRGAMGYGELRSLEQMNRQFDQEAFHLLHKIDSELMTGVGAIDCYKVAGLVAERKYLQDEVFHRMSRPDLFDGIRRYRTTGILLYGPAGNGKTFMANLIAGHIARRYINVQPYYLDSPAAYQLLIAIFRLASSQPSQPSVIVFDNIDQTFRGKNKLQELLASEFSLSMQRGDHIVVIGTTRMECYHHLPKKIADCFEHRIKTKLPDEKERRALISAFMESVRHNLTRSNIRDIADATANRTRGQIEAICRKAASIPALEVPNELIRSAIPSSIRPVTIADFITVLNLRHFPNSPEPIGDSSSMEISSMESEVSQESSDDGAPSPRGRNNFSGSDVQIEFP